MKWLKRIGISIGLVVLSLFLLYQFYFLRLPDRNVPHNPTVFVSPANGIIAAVKPWGGDSVVVPKGLEGAIKLLTADLGPTGTLVSITLNLQNVHYQRAMIAGKYLGSTYREGEFHNALVHENDYGMRFENEHNVMLFESGNGTRYKVVPIAGAAARRIVDMMVDKGPQPVEQGDVIGLIRMGSQVTVVFPAGVDVLVKPGDYVVDGETPFAKDITD